MKIICIGRNYKKHIEELNNKHSSEIIFFLKPETAIPIKNQPFFIPDFSNEIHHELEVIIKINRTGKFIQKRFSHKYYDEISVGIDFTARDIQNEIKKRGLPWEKSKSFDGSAPIGKFIQKDDFKINNLDFILKVNGQIKQKGNSKNMIHSIDDIISYVSQYITLKKGDIIFTGTPSGVGKVQKNDVLKAYLNGQKLLDINVV
tara:strand:+ start:1030 stop:1638 length:609 start_codon:yes stop_codon:yes gene_type:complete